MACRICNRSSCTESFHSLDEQNEVLDAPESTARIRELEDENSRLKSDFKDIAFLEAENARLNDDLRVETANVQNWSMSYLDATSIAAKYLLRAEAAEAKVDKLQDEIDDLTGTIEELEAALNREDVDD